MSPIRAADPPGDQGNPGYLLDHSNALSADGSTLSALWVDPDSFDTSGQSDKHVRVYDLATGQMRDIATVRGYGHYTVEVFGLTPDGAYGTYSNAGQIHRIRISGYNPG